MKKSITTTILSVQQVNLQAVAVFFTALILVILVLACPYQGALAQSPTTTPAPTATPVVTTGGTTSGGTGDMGPLTPIDTQVHLWGGYVFTLITDLVVVVVAIVGMIQCLKAAGSGFLGMNGQTGAAIIAIVGLILVVIITFVALPALIKYLESVKPGVPF
jgi:hypothetical protein